MAATISFVSGKGALAHNNREYIHENIDVDRIKDNIDYKNESLKTAYKKCFGKAVEEYNNRQTRNDRKIKDYMTQIEKSGNNEKLFYETIVQVGDKYSHGFGSGYERQAIDILDEYAKSFQERNPSLYVFNMKMHLDEASPHLHIDYIPVATGYKRGLDIRNSLTKAHENMGIPRGTGKNNNSTMKWQNREKDHLKDLARKHNLEIIDKKTDRKHLTVDEYKIYAEQVEKQYTRYMNSKLDVKNTKVPLVNKVLLDEDEFERLLNNAKYNIVTRTSISKKTKKLEEKEVELNNLADGLKERRKSLDRTVEMLDSSKKNYEQLFADQLEINEEVRYLRSTIEDLKEENSMIEPLLSKIEGLESENENLAYIFANQMKAINMLVHSEEYPNNLDKKQVRLIKALDNYTQGWLKEVSREDLAEEVNKKMGISKGIQENIDRLEKQERTKNRNLARGGR